MTAVPHQSRLRVWVVALALFASGLAARLVLDATPGDPVVQSMYSFTIQGLAYGSGLILLAVWWLRVADVGGRGALGCLAWLVLAGLSALAVLSSGYK